MRDWARLQLGVVGAGSMAQALVGGVLRAGLVQPRQLMVTNRSRDDRLEDVKSRYHVQVTRSKAWLVEGSEVVIVAVKPNDVRDALQEIAPFVREDHLVITVAAGIRTNLVEEILGREVPVVRAMPNTSSQIGESATALALGQFAGEEHLTLARALFATVGQVVTVGETALDAVTGLSGSGPAYVYLMIESLIEAGRRIGLDPQVARDLAIQTVFGAAKMVLETGEDPAELRRRVTSPGGTTMAALGVLEQNGFQAALVQAVARAAERAEELGSAFSGPTVEGAASR